MQKNGFTLIELLVVIAIIGVLAGIVFAFVAPSRDAARDARRMQEISQIGRLFKISCYVPDGGPGAYDLSDIIDELKIKYPQHANLLQTVPKDPRVGTDIETFYVYEITGGNDCVLYANLENEDEKATLSLSDPTPGGGTGVLDGATVGANSTTKYFQVSN